VAHFSKTGAGSTSHNTMVVHTVKLILQTYPGSAGTAADRAIARVSYKAKIGAAAELTSALDADGAIELHIPAGSTATVETLGTTYLIMPVATLEGPATTKGRQRRLQHLGYELGAVDGLVGLKTGTATLEFQADNNLDTDGALTTTTSDKIKTAMGE